MACYIVVEWAKQVDARRVEGAGAWTVARLTIAVGVATTGRPEIVQEALDDLRLQTRRFDELIICPAAEGDVFEDRVVAAGGRIVRSARGLTSQRNAILAACQSDVMLFLDDDFFLAPDYLAELEKVFIENEDVVLVTGNVVRDGILGPGLTIEEARAAVTDLPATPPGLSPVYNGYGCNMAFRMSPVRTHAIHFDEKLPFYGWLEDLDHGRRLAPHGRIVLAEQCRGAHMGVKRGRQSGLKLGYSQVANPAYLARKGSMAGWRAVKIVSKNILANAAKSIRPEPWVDRRGRLKGNLLGLWELIRGKADPGRIRDM